MELDTIPMTSTDKLNELKKSVDELVFASDLTAVTLCLNNSPSIEQGIIIPLVCVICWPISEIVDACSKLEQAKRDKSEGNNDNEFEVKVVNFSNL